VVTLSDERHSWPRSDEPFPLQPSVSYRLQFRKSEKDGFHLRPRIEGLRMQGASKWTPPPFLLEDEVLALVAPNLHS
jgi:hypothetical protein